MPHAAAGPLVTPTKPIFRTGFSANAIVDVVAKAAANNDAPRKYLLFIRSSQLDFGTRLLLPGGAEFDQKSTVDTSTLDR
jgi:hypothetical protein